MVILRLSHLAAVREIYYMAGLVLRLTTSASTVGRQLDGAVRGFRDVFVFVGITAAKLLFVFCTGQPVLQLEEVAMFGLLDYLAYRLVQLIGSASRPPVFGGFGV
jgi:hypothetical protein